MSLEAFAAFAGASASAALAVFVLARHPASFVHRALAAGLIGLSLQEAATGLSSRVLLAGDVLRWQGWRLAAAALASSLWLIFSLSFGRGNYRVFLFRWRWVILGAFVFPLSLIVFFAAAFFAGIEGEASSGWILPLGWSGYALHVFLLLSAVVVLMNLERTLRASTGSMRWSIKFMILGVGGFFAVRIYASSQALLFSTVDTTLQPLSSGALLVAVALVIVSLVRTRLLDLDVYLSQSLLYNSLTVMLVGVYLLAVGLIAQVVKHLGGVQALPLAGFLVFLALMGLTILLLSDEARQRTRRFINRNLRRPHHDYRREWMAFTRRTSSLVEMKALCAAVGRMVSETLNVPSVTLWLLDETQERLALGASTAFSEAQARELVTAGHTQSAFIRAMRGRQMPVDLQAPAREGKELPPRDLPGCLPQARYVVALAAGRESLGFMSLSERPSKEPLSDEDLDLVKTIADQAAASLLHIRLSERLVRAKEMEAFQTLSAFFIHDLKNLASRLSLTIQNLPAHYDDPVFRQDLLSTISRSVTKINDMCRRLSPLSLTLELQRTETDLNQLVAETLAGLNGSLKASLVTDLQPVPTILLDPEQVQKVLINLILNAHEATGGAGEIRIATWPQDESIVLTVSDHGCGMSKEFIARSLFQPFRSTKAQGMGIGLFHSRQIVEAHQGRIEVESEEGKGTTFRVILSGVAAQGERQEKGVREDSCTNPGSSS